MNNKPTLAGKILNYVAPNKTAIRYTNTNLWGTYFYHPITTCESFRAWLYWHVPGYLRVLGWSVNLWR